MIPVPLYKASGGGLGSPPLPARARPGTGSRMAVPRLGAALLSSMLAHRHPGAPARWI